MSKIRGKNTTLERKVRSYLHKKGFRFRLHKKDLSGKPDIVLKKYKAIKNVNGCFWYDVKDFRAKIGFFKYFLLKLQQCYNQVLEVQHFQFGLKFDFWSLQK